MKIINIDPIVNMVLNPLTHEDAAVAGFRVMHQHATEYGGIENMLSRSQTLLSRIARLDKQVAALKQELDDAKRALVLAVKSNKAHAAEQALRTEREVKDRITKAVEAMINGTASRIEASPQPGNELSTTKPTRKVAASASFRSRNRVVARKRRGADTEAMVLGLLTNQWKCISTLHGQALRGGFRGSEGTVRFAADRVADAGNAEQGHDSEGRIAYRRV